MYTHSTKMNESMTQSENLIKIANPKDFSSSENELSETYGNRNYMAKELRENMNQIYLLS